MAWIPVFNFFSGLQWTIRFKIGFSLSHWMIILIDTWSHVWVFRESVEVFISKAFNTYQKQVVYLVALDRCDQSSLDTLCIADVVLDQFSKDNPHIKRIEIKSDNAGQRIFLATWMSCSAESKSNFRKLSCEWYTWSYVFFGKKRGITISAYNYNEAQLVCIIALLLALFCISVFCI